MNKEEKAFELFDIEEPAEQNQEKTRNVSELQEFAFEDILIDDDSMTRRVPDTKDEEAKSLSNVRLDLDGKPVGGTAEQKKKQYKKDRRRAAGSTLSGILGWLKELAIALLIVWFVITFVAQNNKVVGTSMQPTVYANDMVIVNKFIYRFTSPSRGDIIVFPSVENGEKVYLIKRIIGLPGDVVDIHDGKVYVNEVELKEDYISVETTAVSGQVVFPMTVPEGEYFVLGDNRIVSKDSRYLSVGTIPRSKIIGKASIRIWPFKNIGFIE